MSGFTDEALARLKEDTKRTLSGIYLTKAKVTALLARLQAAEDAVIAFHIIPSSNWTERIRFAVAKWRRSKGE